MSQTESIFNPLDNSLAERVRAYYSVCQAFSHSQSSLKQTDRSGVIGYLGENKEVKSAFKIINQSFSQANREVSQSDLQLANAEGLLSNDQMLEIVKVRRSQEMVRSRESQEHSGSDKNSHNQEQ